MVAHPIKLTMLQIIRYFTVVEDKRTSILHVFLTEEDRILLKEVHQMYKWLAFHVQPDPFQHDEKCAERIKKVQTDAIELVHNETEYSAALNNRKQEQYTEQFGFFAAGDCE